MIWLLAIPAVLLMGLLVVDFQISAPGHKGSESDHFDGKKFINPDKIKGRSLWDMLKWALSGDRGHWPHHHEENDITFPQPSSNRTLAATDDIAVTFVNHSTFLIRLAGINILTDPVWSKRVSPYSWVGPKRMRPPGLRFEDLPPIDAVLLTHNHYDHLDLPTVIRLKKEHDPQFIAPLGVSQFLNHYGISKTADMDWGDSFSLNEALTVNSTPAQHFSGRGVFDRDQTLWCGYMLQTPADTLYFAGDTAYGSFFPEIAQKYPSIDLAFIPIGAYKPRWFMQPIHSDPEEAVKIHQEVSAAQSIGMHFGTFPLADEGKDEPLRDLQKAKERYGLAPKEFIILKEGVRKVFKSQPV